VTKLVLSIEFDRKFQNWIYLKTLPFSAGFVLGYIKTKLRYITFFKIFKIFLASKKLC